MYQELITVIILLLFSGFFSSSELAFVVSNKIKIELRARSDKLWAKNALYFVEKPGIFFSTILICNNIVNIAFASVATLLLHQAFGFDDYTILIVSSISLLIVGELVPKYFAHELPDRFVRFSSTLLRIFTFLLYPLVKLTSSFSNLLTSTADLNEENIGHLFDREEFQTLVTESSTAGKLDNLDSDVIGKILELGDQKVYEAMTPRTDIVGIEITLTPEDAIKLFIASGYSKLLVYEESLDDIKGFIHAYDMFKMPEDLKSITREIRFVPETKKSLEMLNEFLDNQESIAIVVDEFGGTAGIITVEDILEEMLGEIRDEYDVEDEICRKIDKDIYIVSGKVEIDYFNEQFDIELPEGDYETLSGFVTTNSGTIPEEGNSFTIDNKYRINVLRADKKRIELLKLTVLPQ
jgi:CBS domain containing-hemolysin-like protein